MKLKYNFVVNHISGETVAVAVGSDLKKFKGIIKMNETGAFIFERLKKDTGREEIVNALLEEYDITKDRAGEAVDTFIEKLQNAGAI